MKWIKKEEIKLSLFAGRIFYTEKPRNLQIVPVKAATMIKTNENK